jgi:hypothetical protein
MATGGVVFSNIQLPLVRYRAHEGQVSKTKGRLLDRISKKVAADYTVKFLNNAIISEYVNSDRLTIQDFEKFFHELAVACHNKSSNINTFRPLIALQYKKLEMFGLASLYRFMSISNSYGVKFPPKYLLNLLILSMAKFSQDRSIFNTLTKLKL